MKNNEGMKDNVEFIEPLKLVRDKFMVGSVAAPTRRRQQLIGLLIMETSPTVNMMANGKDYANGSLK